MIIIIIIIIIIMIILIIIILIIIVKNKKKKKNYNNNIGFPGQFRRFVIPFDEGVIQIREINLGHQIRSSNLYFGHSNSPFGQEI